MIAGAVTAVAVSSIVIALGSGIGMSVISPYSYSSSPSAGTMTVIGALWLVFAQAVGFATGGYVAGRLRRAPTSMHTDEVNFRDGANGLIVWAIGVVADLSYRASRGEQNRLSGRHCARRNCRRRPFPALPASRDRWIISPKRCCGRGRKAAKGRGE